MSMNSSSSPPLSAFTYRYLERQPATPAEQAQHPETISDPFGNRRFPRKFR
jgi:hypothetical protein